MAVEGYLYPVRQCPTETCFLGFTSTWGWGTWARAWNQFNPSAEALLEIIPKSKKWEFNIGNSYDFYGMLMKCVTGSWKFWDVRWYASVYVKRGMCLYPKKSLVRNIGNDTSGMHCLADAIFQLQEIGEGAEVVKQIVREDKTVRRRVAWFLWCQRMKNFRRRIISRLAGLVARGSRVL